MAPLTTSEDMTSKAQEKWQAKDRSTGREHQRFRERLAHDAQPASTERQPQRRIR